MTKKELLHAHILIRLIKKNISNEINKVISAEIPDLDIELDQFEVVTNNKIHGPCDAINNNSLCMKSGKCTKRYPKDLYAETVTVNDGYP